MRRNYKSRIIIGSLSRQRVLFLYYDPYRYIDGERKYTYLVYKRKHIPNRELKKIVYVYNVYVRNYKVRLLAFLFEKKGFVKIDTERRGGEMKIDRIHQLRLAERRRRRCFEDVFFRRGSETSSLPEKERVREGGKEG